MRAVFPKFLPCLLLALLTTMVVATAPMSAQQAPDNFRWVDFHSEKENDTIVWVTRSLAAEKWTAIREIGVEYDAALVLTTLRATPESAPNADTFTIWSVSLTSHALTPVIKGVNLRLLDWIKFTEAGQGELSALYDDCGACGSPTTYFTAFHFDVTQHAWTARWLRGGQTAPVWSTTAPDGVALGQVYALLAEPNGPQFLTTWNHFDYGKVRPAEDYIHMFDLDPFSGLERTQLLSGKAVDEMKQRLCRAQIADAALARGQDSPLCQQIVNPHPDRKPVTSPPANNRGRSTPPGARH
jgi:hypothetical protein